MKIIGVRRPDPADLFLNIPEPDSGKYRESGSKHDKGSRFGYQEGERIVIRDPDPDFMVYLGFY